MPLLSSYNCIADKCLLFLEPVWKEGKGKGQVWAVHFCTIQWKKPAVPWCNSVLADNWRRCWTQSCSWLGLCCSPAGFGAWRWVFSLSPRSCGKGNREELQRTELSKQMIQFVLLSATLGSSLSNSLVRWCCISSAELQKCEEWALNVKSDPLVCVQADSMVNCIELIKVTIYIL